MTNTKFSKILEPFQIKQVKLRNRIVKPAQGIGFCAENGFVSERLKSFYESLASGGVGLIIVGATTIDFPLSCSKTRMISTDDDKYIPGLSELAQVIHKNGCPTFLQLYHAGPAMQQGYYGVQPIAASSLQGDEKPLPAQDTARALTIPEIHTIVGYFANSAERARKAGFDGVEIHAAHNYLINSFLSRGWNKRRDEYGTQSLENRSRFLVEILQAIRERVGRDFPIGVRFNGSEWGIKDGITFEEAAELAKIFEKSGADYLHVSGLGSRLYHDARFPEMLLYPEPPEPLADKIKEGLLVPGAAAIKKVVSIPVITVGRLDPELGEKILKEGKADLIAMGRRLLADPQLPNKLAAGRMEDIAPCTACLECLERIRAAEPARCRINAALGKEKEYVIRPAEKKKKVMVVGGGPAGMEAARVAALKGHEVLLYEKEPKLGGLLPIAALVKGTQVEDLPAIIRYLTTQISKLGVKIYLGKEVSPALLDSVRPDVLVLAAGGVSALPDVPGINHSKVTRIATLHRTLKFYLGFVSPSVLNWLTKLWMPVGRRVVIMGGAIQGCELAEFLAKRGRKVTIVETSDKVGTGIAFPHMERLLAWFAKEEVNIIMEAKYERVNNEGLIIITKDGRRQTIKADTIIPALSFKLNTELFKAFENKAPEVYLIGDCREPNLIVDAIDDGMRTACRI